MNVLRSETVDPERKRKAVKYLSREIVSMKHLMEQIDEIWNDVASKSFDLRTNKNVEKRSDDAYEIVAYLRDLEVRGDDDTVESARESILCKKLLGMLESLKQVQDLEEKNLIERVSIDVKVENTTTDTEEKTTTDIKETTTTDIKEKTTSTDIKTPITKNNPTRPTPPTNSTTIQHEHYPGCGCLPPVPSLFEMARRRKEYMRRKKMEEEENDLEDFSTVTI